MKLKNLLTTTLITATMLLWSNVGWGQQVIGEFPQMDGGYENQSGTLGNTLSTTVWSRQSGTGSSITSTGGRSGPKYVTANVNASTRLLQSPQDVVAANGPQPSTAYVVQFYYKSSADFLVFQIGVTVNGTSNPTYSTGATLPSTSGVWTKYTGTVTTPTATLTSCGIGIIRGGTSASGGPIDVDDFVIYPGTEVDETRPNSPGTVTISNEASTSLDVSWGAADGGVDGGGYVVVRFESDPGTGNNPNQNGIYAVGNTIPTGGTVCYIGTNASFTDIGLTAETDYWYKVYTVDKAFNYSDATTGTGSTIAGASTYQVTFSVIGGNGNLTAEVDGGSEITSGDFVDAGEDVIFTAEPAVGYQVKEWTLNTNLVEGNTTENYTIVDLQAASNVTVEFELIPPKYLVTFTIADSEGPIEGAIVTVTGFEPLTATNSSGQTTIELEDGTYSYSVSASGYFDYSDSFIVDGEALSIPVLIIISVIEDFDYVAGTLLTDVGYSAHSAGGTNSITVTNSSISYSGYTSSGVGNEVLIFNNGEDVNKTIPELTSGDIYAALIVNITDAKTAGDYFFHLAPSTIGSIFRGRLFAKKDANDKVAFGITHTGGTPAYTDFNYDLNTSYLIVMKYSIVDGANNDEVGIYINPDLQEAEPVTGWLVNTDAPSDPANIGSYAFRQGNATNAPTVLVDGLRISKVWGEAVKYDATKLAPVVTFAPIDEATDVEVDIIPTISFDVAIRNIDNSEITNENVDNLITFKDAAENSVTFDATINEAKTLITITLASNLDYETTYTITLAPVEGDNNVATVSQSVSFTTKDAPKPITFNVDMGDAVAKGFFEHGTDNVDVAGSFNSWGDPVMNLTRIAETDVYTYTTDAIFVVDQEIEFKFRINTKWGNAQPASNVEYTVIDGENIYDYLWATPQIGWANLQWPENAIINIGNVFNAFAQVWIDGVTNSDTENNAISAWIGIKNTNSDPSTWGEIDWFSANFNGRDGNNHEYMLNMVAPIDEPGTYFYASRFQYGDDEFVYGGYSESGGTFWDGTDNVSGELYVNNDDASIDVFTLGGEDVTALGGLLVEDPELDPGATLFVADFTGFQGIVIEPTDENAEVVITLNGGVVDPLDYETQTLEDGDIVVATVTAENEVTVNYYKVTLTSENRTLTLTAPTGGEVYYVGDDLIITWTSENIDNVNIWVYDDELEALYPLNEEPVLASEGTFTFYLNNGAGGAYFVRVADANDASFYDQSATKITLIDEVVPAIEELYPPHLAVDIDLSFTLSITFDEHILVGTGDLTIYEMDGDVLAATYTQGDVSYNEKTATIEVSGLSYSTEYYVNIDEGMIEDHFGNGNVAIDDNTTWSFTTVAEPVSATIDPISAEFDLYNPDAMATVITWNDASSIESIDVEGTPIDAGFYTVEINDLTINDTYFADAEVNDVIVFTINFNVGNPATFTVNVVDNTPFYTVTFTVTDGTDPIVGAIVTVDGFDSLDPTDALGQTTIDLPNDTYNFTVTADGFEEYTDNFTVAGDDLPVLVVMTEAASEPDIIASWNFENEVKRSLITDNATFLSNPYTADDGIAANKDIAPITILGSIYTSWVNGTGGTGTFAANSNTWNGGANINHWKVTISTMGHKDIKLSSKQMGSNTGPRDFQLEYSINGEDWNIVPDASITVLNDLFTSGVLENVTLPDACNNQPSLSLRWLVTSEVAINGGAVASTGSDRIDDIIITGVFDDTYPPVPTFFPANSTVDVPVDVNPTITFNEDIFLSPGGAPVENADLGDLITFVDGDEQPVEFGPNIVDNVITIVPIGGLANNTQYTITMGIVEDASGNAMEGIASTTFTTIAADAPVLTLTSEHDGLIYYAGDEITVTWEYANLNMINVEVWHPFLESWQIVEPNINAEDLSFSFNIPSITLYSNQYRIRVRNAQGDGTPVDESGNFTIRAVANNIATIRGYADNAEFRFDGTALVTATDAYNNRKFIEDETAAIMIYDPNPAVITSPYVVGDEITSLIGKKTVSNDMVRLVPLADPGIPSSTGNPVVSTTLELDAVTTDDQAKLLSFEDISIVETGTFANGTNYTITDGTNNLVLRTDFYNVNYIGQPIPTVNFNITGVLLQYNTTLQLVPRNLADFVFFSSDASLAVFTLGGEDVTELGGLLVVDPENDPGATLFVDDFTGFQGIAIEPTDVNATVSVTLNGELVDPLDYDTQELAQDDVIVATVTAEDEVTVNYYKVTLTAENRVLTLTAPVGGETYETGDEMIITWTSENVAFVNIWAYNEEWEELYAMNEEPIDASEESFTFNVFNGAWGTFYIRITDANDPSFYDQSAGEITLIDNVEPSIAELFPENNAIDVMTSFTLSIEFDEHILIGTGNLTIHKTEDDLVVATYTEEDVTYYEKTASVEVAGLSYSTEYYVNIDEGLIEDHAGNSFAGISDNSTWTFTTMDEPVAAELLFSEYSEAASGNNKYIEIYNASGADVNLEGYFVRLASNGGAWGNTATLSGTLVAGEVFVIANASATPNILDLADMTSDVTFFNGNDALGLFFGEMLIDVIGIQGQDPGAGWDVAGVTAATKDHTLVRKFEVTQGNTNWPESAGTNAEDSEWLVFDWSNYDYLGWHGPFYNDDATLAVFELGGESVLGLYGIMVNDPENDTGASLFVDDFSSFIGIVTTPNDVNATVTITINGIEISEDDYATQEFEPGDIVLATVVAEDGETTKYYLVTLTDIQIISATLDTEEIEIYTNWPNDPIAIEITWNDAAELVSFQLEEDGIWVPLPPMVNEEVFWEVIDDDGTTATLMIYPDNSPAKGGFGKDDDYYTGETALTRAVFDVGIPSEIDVIFKVKTFLLTFDVKDEQGNPVTGAIVTVEPEVESDGGVIQHSQFEFEVGATSTYRYTVVATGYEIFEGLTEAIMADQTIEVELISSAAMVIALWDFEDEVKRTAVTEGANNLSLYTPDQGDGTISIVGAVFTAWNLGAPSEGFAANSNAWQDGVDTKFWKVEVSTAGYETIKVSSKQKGSNTGPRDFSVQYSLDNENWVDVVDDLTIANDNFISGVVMQVQLPEECENQEVLYLRWVERTTISINGGEVASTGTNRIDDIIITGEPGASFPPIATFNPANGAVNVPINVNPTISFDKPIRNIDDSEITNDNAANLIGFTDGEDAVALTATINAGKTLITITPDELLLKGITYTLTLAPVEGENDNATLEQSISFTTVLPGSIATLATFTLGDENALDLVGVVVDDPDVDEGAILYVDDFTNFIGIEVVPTDANANVAITINDDLVDEVDFDTQTFADGDVVVATVVAEDGETTMYYKVTVVIDDRELELTYPTGGEIFYAGDDITITWTSANIANVNLWAYDAEDELLHLLNEEGPIPAANGTYDLTIENGVQGDFFIRITDAIDPTFYDQTDSEVTVLDELMPSIVSTYPAHQATNVSIIFTLSIEFDEDVTDGSGNFTINKLSDDTPVITVTSEDFNIDYDMATLQVENLDFSTAYYIAAVEGVFEDAYGNLSPAITKTGDIQWHFTTMDEPDTDLFFSEYIEGSSNNKALEIYNPTGMVVNLDNYRIAQSNNGGGWEYYHYFPTGATIAAGDVWVMITDAVDPSFFSSADADEVLAYPSVVHFNGNDARALERTANGTDYYMIDVFGDPNSDANFNVAGVTGAALDHTLVRKSSVASGNTDWASSAGTNADDSEWIVYPQNTFEYLGWHFYGLNFEADILSFATEYQMAPAVIDNENATITLEVLYGSGLDAIVPTFTLSSGATAFIDGVQQVSGTSVVDFTNPVVYTIIAEDGTSQREWTVTITEAEVSSAAEIINFIVDGQMGNALIDSENATVTVQVTVGVDVTNLIPQITISLGATIDPESGIAQDFSEPVEYTVTAQDEVTQKVWTVTVIATELTTIYEIQYTEEASGDSPFAGQVVTTSGVVTAWHYNYEGGEFQGFFIQDGVGAWNGLYVYDKQLASIAPAIGDSIIITGMIKEYYGITELTFDNTAGVQIDFDIVSSDNELPAPFLVSTIEANGEPWESVLIKVMNARCTNDDAGYGMIEVDDDSGPILVDDDIYAAELTLNERYDIVGIGHYSYSEYKILPRSADDVNLSSSVIITWGENINTFPNPFSHTIWIDNAQEVVRVNIFNLIGQQVMSITTNGEERASIQTDSLPYGVYLVAIMNANGERTVRKMIKSKY
jgi:predicted extracellular nuclease